MAIPPSQAGPQSAIWDEVIKTRSQMCKEARGDKAFADYVTGLFKPHKFSREVARDVAVRLRLPGENYWDAFPLSDIIVALNGCPGPRVREGHTGTPVTENQIGRWIRDAGVVLWYPTRHLNGRYSASMAGGGPAVVIAKAVANIRNAADVLAEMDPSEVASCLDDEARKQLSAFAHIEMNRASRVFELLKKEI